MNKGFNLVELIVVLVIVGIIITFAAPQFGVTKERALDKEAKATVALIQAAERIYKMEAGFYYPPAASTSVVADINTWLKLDLSAAAPSWTYAVDDSNKRTTASRKPSGSRVWTLTFSGDTPVCTGTACPP
ncbi:MAG: prepilin-type N-terminal cleavage/methylation domain-containing protein [Candidatus Omnitrophota bacterium]